MGCVVFRIVRVFRVSWPNTRITRINFGYRGLEPGLGFGFELGFFRFGFRVSGFLPFHTSEGVFYLMAPEICPRGESNSTCGGAAGSP